MSATETVAPPIEAMKARIDRSLPTNSRSRITLLRALILLLQARTLPNFLVMSSHLLHDMAIDWPTYHAKHETIVLVGVSDNFDEPTAQALVDHCWERLNESMPKDSLMAHFAAKFGGTCTYTDHMGKACRCRSESMIKLMLTVTLPGIEDLREDFTLLTDAPISNEQLHEVTGAYFVEHGYEVRYQDGFVSAEKGEEELYTKFTNDSAEGTVLVTIGEI